MRIPPARATGLTMVLVGTVAAHCPHTPWGFGPERGPNDSWRVFFDSGAVMRVDFDEESVITGYLLKPFVPGSRGILLCVRPASCSGPDASSARDVPLPAIRRLRIPDKATGVGADIGFRLGGLAALAQDEEDTGMMMLGMLAGAVVGGGIGSRFTRWITVAERTTAALTWIPPTPLLIPAPPGDHEFLTACAHRDAPPRGRIVAVARSVNRAYYTEFTRVWDVDTIEGRLVLRNPDGIRCRNPQWPGPDQGAGVEHEARALSFTPSPTKARIYVYQTNRAMPDDIAAFEIVMDGETVGRVDNGTYVMVEVEPGVHEVAVREESAASLSVDAAPDSAYFVMVWRKMGFKRPRFGGLSLLEPTEGRRLVTAGLMVPSRR